MTPNDIPTDDIVYPICVVCKRGEHAHCIDIVTTPQGGPIACGCDYPTCRPMTADPRPVAHNPQDGCQVCGAPLYYCRAPHQGQRKPGWHCRRNETHNYDVAEKDLR